MLIQEQERISNMAKLYFRYGAMNCGKSTSLLQVAYNCNEKGKEAILIKPKSDKKGEDKVVSRIGISRHVDYLIDEHEKIFDVIGEKINELDYILADEAQFFSEDQITELFVISKMYDISVICYGLKSDFKTNSFPGSKRLFELADELQELETICKCGTKARFNARVVNGKYVNEGEQVAIDGFDNVTYESLCGKCYLKEVLHYDIKDIEPEKVKKLK